MAIKLHNVGTNQTNLKHYSCVSGQNHFAVSTDAMIYCECGISNITWAKWYMLGRLWSYLCEWTMLT